MKSDEGTEAQARKRAAHDDELHSAAVPEQQLTRRRRRTEVSYGTAPSTVISTVIVNDHEEFHLVICQTEGCRQRPSPQKRAQHRDLDGKRPRKRICCTLCACATTMQNDAETARTGLVSI
jgi:hypothetical protein